MHPEPRPTPPPLRLLERPRRVPLRAPAPPAGTASLAWWQRWLSRWAG